ncbi:MAG: bifunctional pyr operon transcriptional regulator/uracil phosphoribosyltransferase, partial [Deltaproteobacteria bacterium]|nr:bifunctional pyr operon transcriptional regulator/uracil phosphoribosyltransferase [Deltaproteobacteria bacterium]
MESPTVLMNAEEMARTLDRLAYQILEKRGDSPDLALIGIQRRGADLANRITAILQKQLRRDIPCGALDIA